MTRYDLRMKVAISLPDEALARIDSAAARIDVSRSEFLRTAGLRLAVEVESGALTEHIDRHLASTPDTADDVPVEDALRARARASAIRVTAGDDW